MSATARNEHQRAPDATNRSWHGRDLQLGSAAPDATIGEEDHLPPTSRLCSHVPSPRASHRAAFIRARIPVVAYAWHLRFRTRRCQRRLPCAPSTPTSNRTTTARRRIAQTRKFARPRQLARGSKSLDDRIPHPAALRGWSARDIRVSRVCSPCRARPVSR